VMTLTVMAELLSGSLIMFQIIRFGSETKWVFVGISGEKGAV